MQALLRLLVGTRFQVLFHSPPGVLFTFPSRYLSTIGHRRVFRVGGWSPRLPTGFHVSGSTQVPPGSPLGFAYGALTLSRRPSQAVPLPRGFVTAMWVVLQPRRRRSNRRFALGPRSLATTRGISFDFSSSGYLDVSKRICAPNRGLSQLVTSFVGFLCQGIHRVPLPSSSRWLGTYIHPGGLSVAGAIRCDLLEKEKYRLCHAMQLSRYGEGEPSRPDTARSRAAKGISGNGRAPSRL